MEAAFITPTSMLGDFATKSKYHLVLAHIYLENEAYRNFYKERVAAGDFVLLDNGAYELTEGLQVDELLECAFDLNPTAVFIPDYRFDTQKTKELALAARQKLQGHGWKLFGVPQGSNLEEVMDCYKWFKNQDWIDGFGIYEEIGEVTKLGRRWDFLAYLEQNDLVDENKYYHMLGMEEDISKIQYLSKYPWASGIDSAKAVVYGLYGIRLSSTGTTEEYPHRPKNYFNLPPTTVVLKDIIENNIQKVLSWCKG